MVVREGIVRGGGGAVQEPRWVRKEDVSSQTQCLPNMRPSLTRSPNLTNLGPRDTNEKVLPVPGTYCTKEKLIKQTFEY